MYCTATGTEAVHSEIGEPQAGEGMECENMPLHFGDFPFLFCWPSVIPIKGNGVCLPWVGITAASVEMMTPTYPGWTMVGSNPDWKMAKYALRARTDRPFSYPGRSVRALWPRFDRFCLPIVIERARRRS